MNQFTIPLKDLPLYAGFVQPLVCNELTMAGLTKQVHYQWKVYPCAVILHTNAFDADEYYIDGNKHTDAICPPDMVLPAYQTKDLEQMIGDYKLYCEGGLYKLVFTHNTTTASVTAERLPDAFAYAVVFLLYRKAICINKANALLLHTVA